MLTARQSSFMVLSIVAMVLVGCGPRQLEATSETKHLTPQMPACETNDSRAQQLLSELGPVTSGATELAGYAYQQVSMLPEPYLNYIVKRAKAGQMVFRIRGLQQGVAGLTWGGFNGSEPSQMELAPSQEMIRQAVLHEFGHALQTFTFNAAGYSVQQEMSMAQQALQSAMASQDAQSMWSYAGSSALEYWASAFSHYYCGSQARAEMQRLFPVTYKFMDGVIKKAESNLGVTKGDGQGNQSQSVFIALPDEGSQSRLAFSLPEGDGSDFEFCEYGDSCNSNDSLWQSTRAATTTQGVRVAVSQNKLTLSDSKAIQYRYVANGKTVNGEIRISRRR